jgi:manganese/zinc/iron transport system permease protein
VGVVLMSAMVIAPAAAARQWTNSLTVMVLLAALFGAVAGVTGAVISATGSHIPTGPMIVLAATAVVAFSFTLAPERGLIWAALRRRRQRHAVGAEAVLADLYALARQHGTAVHGHEVGVLDALRGRSVVRRALAQLEARDLARADEAGRWHLTGAGRAQAEQDRSVES